MTTAFGENGLEVPVGGKVVIGEVFDRVDRPGAEVAAQREAARGQGVLTWLNLVSTPDRDDRVAEVVG